MQCGVVVAVCQERQRPWLTQWVHVATWYALVPWIFFGPSVYDLHGPFGVASNSILELRFSHSFSLKGLGFRVWGLGFRACYCSSPVKCGTKNALSNRAIQS